MAAIWSLLLALILLQAHNGVHTAVLVDVPGLNLRSGTAVNETNSTDPLPGTAQTEFAELDTTPLTLTEVQTEDTTWIESATQSTDATEGTSVPYTENTENHMFTVSATESIQPTSNEIKHFEIIHSLNSTEIIDAKYIYSNGSGKVDTTDTNNDNNIAKTYYKVDNKHSKDIPTSIDKEGKDRHSCARECIIGDPPMKCHYTFVLEWYYIMSKACFDCANNATDCDRMDCIPADGVKRPIIVVNRQMPGPSVEVCQGDIIVVDLVNNMMEETTTIHWHGHHQKGTPYMDGVPYVTQCPIPPKTTFRYRYMADTTGTHFWHSHSGCQRADGAYGALIVRVPRSNNPHDKLYDFDLSDHTIQIIDWGHELGIDKFVAHHHSTGDNKPMTLLVNGRGWVGGITNNSDTHMPSATFQVEKGYRYRFRLINSGFLNCPIEVSVDNHTLLVISSDGSDLQPIAATSLVSYAGERFDFILETNQSIANYWMRFRGLMDCGEQFNRAHQVAILRYSGAAEDEEPQNTVTYETSHRPGNQINSLNVGPGTNDSVVIPELDALSENDISLKPEPDMKLFLSYDFHDLDNPHYNKAPYYGFNNVTVNKLYTPQFNHVSMKLQPFPLLSGRDLLQPDMLCNQTTFDEKCKESYCECTHVVNVPLGAVLELILIDLGNVYDANHPFHLHGHAFRVVAMDRLGKSTTVEEVKSLDDRGLIKRKLFKAPIKDTVTVPDGGYTVLRIHAANPGYWLFHCHIEFHVELGMSVVFKVGEHSDIPPVPRGFPQCNDWMPDDLEEELITVKEVSTQQSQGKPSSGYQTLSSSLLLIVFLVVPFL